MKLATRVGLAACVALGAIVPASANHSWSNYRWGRTSNPVQLRINSAVTGTWSTYVNIAINEWDASSKLDLKTFAPRSVSVSRKQCSPIPNEVLVCNDSYGKRGWLGIASVWLSGGRIAQATTKLNDTYFADPYYDTPAWRRLVTCQEIAHDFGLDHQDETFDNENLGSCMDYTDDPDGSLGDQLSNEHPNTHDYAELRAIYDHIDTGGGGGGGGGGNGRGRGAASRDIFPTPADQRLEFDHPYQWGRQLRGNGHVALFDAGLGNDNHVFTFVIWAR